MMIPQGVEEYLFTAGLSVAFIGMLVSFYLGRKAVADSLRAAGVEPKSLLAAVFIVGIFLFAELALVAPTQQLYFDDAIYQAMSQQLLHTGQAWMCDYGTPTGCSIGEIFHEPIGTSFNIAIGFAIAGISRTTTFVVGLVLAAAAVFLTFLVGMLLFRSRIAALFAELMMALSPMLLVWAMPTTSDLPMLTYSLIAVLALLVFIRKKSIATFAILGFSIIVTSYMKVDSLVFFVVVGLMFLLMDEETGAIIPSVVRSIRKNAARARRQLVNTKFLVLLLVLVLAATPEVMFAYNELVSGDYGYAGSAVQTTCGAGSITATGNFNLQNFKANICSNVFFWFNQYKSQYVMQPEFFTALALVGVLGTFLRYRREGISLIIWFAGFFLLYTAFYAGSVLYGVDWRFMLSLVAQASLLGGFGCMMIIEVSDNVLGGILSRIREMTSRAGRLVRSRNKIHTDMLSVPVLMAALLFVLIVYATYLLAPQLTIKPSQIPQAQDARFYENFVYSTSNVIPANCLVFTYDPTLFNINNRSAAQMSYVYDQGIMRNITKSYSCLVVDWGYWCYTPNNLCTGLNNTLNMTPIVSAYFSPYNRTYWFYRARLK